MFVPFLINHPKLSSKDVIKIFEKYSIETRPIISGNITKHPVFKNLDAKIAKNLKYTNFIHKKGFMIGCHQNLNTKSILQLKKALFELKNF